ncbi:glycosyl transferase, partial [Candidatus Pacearchaeota archaeon]|nr:glycosyl transferase [Candidatus Pacearchaeota archaeon]
ISKILLAGPYLAASPKMEINYQNSSWPVRSYYEIWQRLPYVKEGMIGTGVFALSEVGRKRFEKFPEIIADDGYIRSLFKSHERISVNNCYSIVQAPSTLDGLLKIKTRSRLGRYELAKKFSHLLQNEEKKYGPALSTLIMDVRLWAKISVYLYVNVITRYRALKYYKEKGYTGWERDNSSRKARV